MDKKVSEEVSNDFMKQREREMTEFGDRFFKEAQDKNYALIVGTTDITGTIVIRSCGSLLAQAGLKEYINRIISNKVHTSLCER